MQELTMNEITEVYGGCECYCTTPKAGDCEYVGDASSITECANACKERFCSCK